MITNFLPLAVYANDKNVCTHTRSRLSSRTDAGELTRRRLRTPCRVRAYTGIGGGGGMVGLC